MSTLCGGPQLLKLTVTGGNGSSGSVALSAPGLKVGDAVLWVRCPSVFGYGPSLNVVESYVSQADQIVQQYGADLSTATLEIALLRY